MEQDVALDRRARRALALMGLAVVGLGIAAGAYLHATAGAGARPAPPRPRVVLTGLDWLSPRAGWVVTTDPRTHLSLLFHTADGGRHWDRQFGTAGGTGGLAPSFALRSPLGVRFLDESHGLLTEREDPTGTPALLATRNGGADWLPLDLPDVSGVRRSLPFFLDLDHGWVVVDGSSTTPAAVYRTVNGGRDWSLAGTAGPGDPAPPGQRPPPAAVAAWFRTSLEGWLVRVQPDGSAAVIGTHDGGSSWRTAVLPVPATGRSPADALLEAPRVAADGHGALVVADRRLLDAAAPDGPASPAVDVYTTSDGGDSWGDPRPAPAGADPRLSAGVFVNGSDGWIVGGASVWLTHDAGRSWALGGRLRAGWSFEAIAPVDDAVAVGAVATGPPSAAGDVPWRLVVTNDGGRTWHDVPRPPPA
jgi:photosystem II stability/assembly factor-like uncharacterized protein